MKERDSLKWLIFNASPILVLLSIQRSHENRSPNSQFPLSWPCANLATLQTSAAFTVLPSTGHRFES